MARLQGVPEREVNWFIRYFFRTVRRRMGHLSEAWTIAAHRPGLLVGWILHEAAYDRSQVLDRRLRTLAQLKVAALVGCPS